MHASKLNRCKSLQAMFGGAAFQRIGAVWGVLFAVPLSLFIGAAIVGLQVSAECSNSSIHQQCSSQELVSYITVANDQSGKLERKKLLFKTLAVTFLVLAGVLGTWGYRRGQAIQSCLEELD